MLQVTFPEIVRVLEGLHSSVPAAEGHGCLCGALCAAASYPIERWLDEIVPDAADTLTEAGQALRILFADTLRALRGDQMEFDLLLPDDNAALKERAVALSQWCQGFLYGFGTAQPASNHAWPEDVEEVLRDLTHIGRATVELEEGSEEEEQAYAEVVEYVRVGVQLVHDELGAVREAAAAGDDDQESSAAGHDPSRLN